MHNESGAVIPIQNIYYLLCYAWDHLDEGAMVDVDSIESPELADLFARVLLSGTRHLIRRGFDRGYLPFAEAMSRLRGKIDIAATMTVNLQRGGVAYCEFDELDHDVLHNRILKTTMARLVHVDRLDEKNREGLAEVLRRLRDVTPITLNAGIFRRVQLHRNNRFYGFLLNVCELVHENLFVEEESGRRRFRDFLRDEMKMRLLFESFIFNFFRIEQRVYRVDRPKIQWRGEFDDQAARDLIPEMRTDVCLINSERKVIIDCKFYRDAFQRNRGVPKLRSENLYQLFAYLKNKELDPGWENCEGMLIYPTVNESLDLNFNLHGHPVRIRTVNLNQDWRHIKQDLLKLIDV
ncbi:MAG: 5-methylcytosine-specific restriction endonuclease system specificity protein McrC [Blastocatellales bacterium]|nr:5-methylcytosine-specific restriction endonuclease system specificity protein McrC [Blastocatellales bacterium]